MIETENLESIVILYMPVVQSGYVHFLERHQNAQTIYIFSSEVIDRFHHLRKDLRALPPEAVQRMIPAVIPDLDIQLLSIERLEKWRSVGAQAQLQYHFIVPDEDIMRELADEYLGDFQITFDPVFLRWDAQKTKAKSKVDPDATVTTQEVDRQFMKLAHDQAKQSADWWRQVGAVLVKDQQVVAVGRNHHLPDDYQLQSAGDPRGNFHKGQFIELSTAQHAEAGLVAQAAREGFSLTGADLYVTTFPCPMCAKLLSETGIQKIYYQDGYSMVDGAEVLKSAGIELIRVGSAE